MIELPDGVAPRSVDLALIDYGGVLRPALGGRVSKIIRPGSRFKAAVQLPPLRPALARPTIARLLQAKRIGGLRLTLPLLGQDQGLPGNAVVDGAGQAGTTLNLRGLTPDWVAREGFWLSAFDADGVPYLYNVSAPGAADGTGDIALTIEPPLRWPLPDGAEVRLRKPVIEGFVDGDDLGWTLDVSRTVGLSFTIEEAG